MTVEIAAIGGLRPYLRDELEKRFRLHCVFEAPDPLAELARLGECVRGLASNGMTGLPRAVIERLPRLEICAIFGVGLETTDLEAARERGIVVTTAPVLYDDVADLAIALGLAASRRIPQSDAFLRKGEWLNGRFPLARKFSTKRAGILGLGRIGMAVAERLQGFKMPIAYYDPKPREGVPFKLYEDPRELASNSDLLFLCAAGGPSTRRFVDAAILDALGPDGVFVNVARGWLVDEPALIRALVEGRLGAAGLDVFEDEPNVPQALIERDNVVLTPHVASSTEETVKDMADCVLENLAAHFEGRPVPNPVPL